MGFAPSTAATWRTSKLRLGMARLDHLARETAFESRGFEIQPKVALLLVGAVTFDATCHVKIGRISRAKSTVATGSPGKTAVIK